MVLRTSGWGGGDYFILFGRGIYVNFLKQLQVVGRRITVMLTDALHFILQLTNLKS